MPDYPGQHVIHAARMGDQRALDELTASGGGRRMDDNGPGQPADVTWMGNPKAGYITLPPGARQMWNNEYFYLDGTVTLHENEGYADYGLVRDTGEDTAPVPQYLTRSTPANPAGVPQHSEVAVR